MTDKPQGKLIPIGDQEIFVIEHGEGGIPVVFIHGGPPGANSWLDFSPVLPYFQDRKTVFVDCPQYGDSSKRPFTEPTWSYHARHVAGALDAIGVETADFVCSSHGGVVALAIAISRPDKVRRIVCSGSEPTFQYPTQVDGELIGASGGKWVGPYLSGDGPTFEKTKALMAGAEWYDESKIPEARIQERMERARGLQELWTTPGVRGRMQDLTKDLPSVSAPVLFFNGESDPFVSAEYALHLASLVQYGDIHLMHKASHHLFAERPRDYSLVVRSFLDASLDE